MYQVHDFWSSACNIKSTDSKSKLGLGKFSLIHHFVCWQYGTAAAQTQFITNLNSFWNYMNYKRAF